MNRFGRGLLTVSAMAVLLAAGFQGGAVAEEQTPPSSSLIDGALDDVNAPDAQANAALDVPEDGEGTVDYNDAKLSFGLDIPASGRPATDDLRATYEGEGQDNSISLEPLANGMRALINIRSPDAPTSYAFDLSGNVADLSLKSDGSVLGLDSNGNEVVTIPTPWAVDAKGAPVPTHYEVNGTILTQVVEHTDRDWAYGITADPSFLWWLGNIAKCTAGIATMFAGPGAAAKLAKIKKIIKSNKALKKVVDKAGGLKKLVGKLATFVKKKGNVSKKDRALIKELFLRGGGTLLSLIDGSCLKIVKEIF